MSNKRISLIIALAAVLALQQSLAYSQTADEGAEFVPGEVIVQFNLSSSRAHLADALQRGSLAVKRHLPIGGKAAGDSGLVVMQTRLPVERAIAVLQNHPAIQYVEPNFAYRHASMANEPNYTRGKTWDMYGDLTSPANPFGSQAGEAWANGNTGSGDFYVGVIDEGIDIRHPELAANIGSNPGEIAGNGIDDDGNGLIDDVNGWDFHHNDNTVFDGGDRDRCKDEHGTHVSGTIGAVGGNGAGIAGMCWKVKILSAKFLGPNGGTSENGALAINYFVNLKTRVNNPVNIVALNASWAGPSSITIRRALVDAANAGIVFCAAAGNDHYGIARFPSSCNTTDSITYPDGTVVPGASWDAVISVAAIDSKGLLAPFSNYSSTGVDLGAPGVNILSTLPGGRYGTWDGTSMATPHVTGACVLYLNTHPQAQPWEIRSAILNQTSATSSLVGKTVTGGRLNVGGF